MSQMKQFVMGLILMAILVIFSAFIVLHVLVIMSFVILHIEYYYFFNLPLANNAVFDIIVLVLDTTVICLLALVSCRLMYKKMDYKEVKEEIKVLKNP
jgi:uncharacterized membrane protein